MTRHESRIANPGDLVVDYNAEMAGCSQLVDKGGGCTFLPPHEIWVLWKANKVHIDVLEMDAQFIHLKVTELISDKVLYVTYVYGLNKLEHRVPLWNALIRLNMTAPWIVLEDFNRVMFSNERIGRIVRDAEMLPFQHTAQLCDLQDIKAFGAFFTWTNKHPSSTRDFSRIDRVLLNDAWLTLRPDYYAHYLPEGDFDHCPCIIECGNIRTIKKRPFKFFNMWSHVKDF
ncbi:uncharacterized protein LOC141627914 [Silene latifolia]|uniref:uncharacterized protein LOC141627914 n=1 Tax=Silene latifolia TaxID=37657 RepID=UPI003D77C232